MSRSIDDYRKLIDKPQGKMFYDMIFRQLNLPGDPPLNILDFGAGFCVTANYYAKHHKVTAIEPNKDMITLNRHDNHFDLVPGDIETVKGYTDHTFDVVICHNVLEYVPDKELILSELAKVLKPGGILSIVKHNLLGRVMDYAVFSDNPKAALDLLEKGDCKNNMFGKRDTYDDESIIKSGYKYDLIAESLFGIRTFFSLSKNDDAKFTQEWYDDMLALEMKVCNLDQYKSISFFHHLIFRKKE